MRKLNFKLGAAAAVMLALASNGAFGAVATFTASGGGRSAEADFDLTGSTLTITLINTAAGDSQVPTDILTGLFFNTTHTLSPVSASLNGSTVEYGSLVNNPGEGWSYASGKGTQLQGNNSGISAAGLNVFGQANFFSPPVTPLDGVNYGIATAGDNPATGNGGLNGPIFKNSLQFVLTAQSGFSLAELGNGLVFQYGTALDEPHLDVPEPTTLIAGALLLLPFGASTLRVIRKNRA